jgi:hypothetical protein
MSRQITLNVSGGMISLSPKDGEKTIIEIVTEKGISYVRNLNTDHHLKVEQNHQENTIDDGSSSQLDEYDKDHLSDESKRMFGFSKLNSDDIETVDDGKDIVKEMTRDLSEKPATNFNYNHDYTPYNDATLFELDEDDKQKFNLTEEDYDRLIQDYDATYGDNDEETFEDEQSYRSSIGDVLNHAASANNDKEQNIDDINAPASDDNDALNNDETEQDTNDNITDSENEVFDNEEENHDEDEDDDTYVYAPAGAYIEDDEEVDENETES